MNNFLYFTLMLYYMQLLCAVVYIYVSVHGYICSKCSVYILLIMSYNITCSQPHFYSLTIT